LPVSLLQEIRITGATIFVNPYKELLEEEAKEGEAKRKQVGRRPRVAFSVLVVLQPAVVCATFFMLLLLHDMAAVCWLECVGGALLCGK
jgi:hypothetical protein